MYGLRKAGKEELAGGDAAENAEIIRSVLNGEKGARRDIVLLNAAAALYVGKAADSIDEGIVTAAGIIDSGKAIKKLEQLKEFTNRVAA